MKLQCNSTSTLITCLPACQQQLKDVVHVPGRAVDRVVWRLVNLHQNDWMDVYAVNPFGSVHSFDVKNRLSNVALLRPYSVTGGEERCEMRVWSILDASGSDVYQPAPVAEGELNMTVFFGTMYSIQEIGVIVTHRRPEEGLDKLKRSELELTFSSASESKRKQLNLITDCSLADDGSDVYRCSFDDLVTLPFNRVQFNAKDLHKLRVFGTPFVYPQVEVESRRLLTDEMQLSCLAVGCDGPKQRPGCLRYGKHLRCQDLQLLRLKPDEEGLISEQSTTYTLVRDGRLVEDYSKLLLGEVKIFSQPNNLTIVMPRTHQFYGQYKCLCKADDAPGSEILSRATDFKPNDFDSGLRNNDFALTEVVFQRTYTASLSEEEGVVSHGMIELWSERRPIFFTFNASALSFMRNVNISIEYPREGLPNHEADRSTTVTRFVAFPKFTNGQQSWPMSGFKHSLYGVYPDTMDGGRILATWATIPDPKDPNSSRKVITDALRVIMLDPTEAGKIRGWLWRNDDEQTEFRVYYQVHSNATVITKGIPSTTSPGIVPKGGVIELRVVEFACQSVTVQSEFSRALVSDDDCRPLRAGQDPVTCLNTVRGNKVLVFNIPGASLTSRFVMQWRRQTDQTDQDSDWTTLAEVASASADFLHLRLREAKLRLEVVSVEFDEAEPTSRLGIRVHLLSKALIDVSKCMSVTMGLKPSWDEEAVTQLPVSGPSLDFTIQPPSNTDTVRLIFILTMATSTGEQVSSEQVLDVPNPSELSSLLCLRRQ
ncbi:hypothetical protein Ciccas_001764 [Cichlidogyrus casuarinus]|uniref:Uncharacterized protein n=1 Tax=Cichlidogyrus casuarinus TaxID=1844966 RepID=A0ABD2QJG1_9PLAT